MIKKRKINKNTDKLYKQLKLEGINMVSYKKLWVKLAELELKKKDLCRIAGISATVVTKMGRGESVTTDVLVRVCKALDCDIGDIMEVVKDKDSIER